MLMEGELKAEMQMILVGTGGKGGSATSGGVAGNGGTEGSFGKGGTPGGSSWYYGGRRWGWLVPEEVEEDSIGQGEKED